MEQDEFIHLKPEQIKKSRCSLQRDFFYAVVILLQKHHYR